MTAYFNPVFIWLKNILARIILGVFWTDGKARQLGNPIVIVSAVASTCLTTILDPLVLSKWSNIFTWCLFENFGESLFILKLLFVCKSVQHFVLCMSELIFSSACGSEQLNPVRLCWQRSLKIIGLGFEYSLTSLFTNKCWSVLGLW